MMEYDTRKFRELWKNAIFQLVEIRNTSSFSVEIKTVLSLLCLRAERRFHLTNVLYVSSGGLVPEVRQAGIFTICDMWNAV
jgi:hypothetical protein